MSDFNTSLIDDLRANGGHATKGPFIGRQVLILTTTGAKSGERRESPLAYSTDGDNIVIVASMGGAPQHPAWYHNLVAHPAVQIEVDGKTYEATATVVDEAERRRLYDAHAALHPSFGEYEARTGGRVIPVIVVQPQAARVAA
jgi:deazaflavin-dependent oxidoreductase (nitroreductase family)